MEELKEELHQEREKNTLLKEKIARMEEANKFLTAAKADDDETAEEGRHAQGTKTC